VVTAVLTADQLAAVEQLIDRVSERQRQDFGHISSDLKADGTLITACDRWSDAAFVEGLAEIAQAKGF
jgi:myo-inositol-1(or 4)-monophosphatase